MADTPKNSLLFRHVLSKCATMNILEFTSIALVGLAGSMHCIGMCGGFVAGYSMLSDARRDSVGGNVLRSIWKIVDHILFNLGRLITYSVLGTVAGALGEATFRGLELAGLQNFLAIISGILIILSGLMLLGIIPGRIAIERAFSSSNSLPFVWLRKLLRSSGPAKTLPLGLVVGLLPCPLVYSVLLRATATGSWFLGTAVMFIFGVGTVPIMLTLGIISRIIGVSLKSRIFQFAAVVIILVGVLTVRRGIASGEHCHLKHLPVEIHFHQSHESPVN